MLVSVSEEVGGVVVDVVVAMAAGLAGRAGVEEEVEEVARTRCHLEEGKAVVVGVVGPGGIIVRLAVSAGLLWTTQSVNIIHRCLFLVLLALLACFGVVALGLLCGPRGRLPPLCFRPARRAGGRLCQVEA